MQVFQWVTTNKDTHKSFTVADCSQTPGDDLVCLSTSPVERKQTRKPSC